MSNACTKCGFDIDAQIERIRKLERENAELVKFIEQCSEDRYARVACLEFLRTRSKTKKKKS